MSIYANPVAPNLKFFRGPKRMENRLVLNVDQKRFKRFSPSLASHPEESSSLPLREKVVLLVDIRSVVVVDDVSPIKNRKRDR
jgi:hypothetical protein